jgi:hypothetical protein
MEAMRPPILNAGPSRTQTAFPPSADTEADSRDLRLRAIRRRLARPKPRRLHAMEWDEPGLFCSRGPNLSVDLLVLQIVLMPHTV